jgi:antitoxin component YwqK of YwqJK toxin-antitoxin module
MKKILLTITPLLLIVICSKVEGQPQLIQHIKENRDGEIEEIIYYKKTQTRLEKIKVERYFENGQKESKETFKDGKRDGLGTWWYENGQKFSEGTYKDGSSDGLWNYWYENGEREMERTYKDGEMISSKRWNEDGSEVN